MCVIESYPQLYEIGTIVIPITDEETRCRQRMDPEQGNTVSISDGGWGGGFKSRQLESGAYVLYVLKAHTIVSFT